jgi:hypothetical protein
MMHSRSPMMSSRSLAAVNGVSVVSLYDLNKIHIAAVLYAATILNSIATYSLRSGSSDMPTSKACRERMRRNKLNDR